MNTIKKEDRKHWNLYNYNTGEFIAPATEEDIERHNQEANSQGLWKKEGVTVFIN